MSVENTTATAQQGTPTCDSANTVREGDFVIIEENGEALSFVHIKHKARIRAGKSWCSVDPLIGAAYGSVFQSDGRGLVQVDRAALLEDYSKQVEVEKNNSGLYDVNDANQSLKKEDIEAMKLQGKGGHEIVDALISNSTTFGTKTQFSQDKYKRKKALKYCTYITVIKPTAASIGQAMFDKGPSRIWNLRPDSLALMLSLANVSAFSRVLVVESCCGVVTAAVAERMGGFGQLCAATAISAAAPLDALRYLNLSKDQRTSICTTGLGDLHDAKVEATRPKKESIDAPPTSTSASVTTAEGLTNGTTPAATTAAAAAAVDGDKSQTSSAPVSNPEASTVAKEAAEEAAPAAVDHKEAGDVDMVDASGEEQKQAGNGEVEDGGDGDAAGESTPGRKRGREDASDQLYERFSYKATSERLLQLVQPGFSSCILAAPQIHSSALLKVVLPLLAPSAPFVVFGPSLEPLAAAQHELVNKHQAVGMRLQESWMRESQVLPSRTHPHMTTTGTGGFILSGIKVDGGMDEAQATVESSSQQKAHQGPGARRHDSRGRGGKRGGNYKRR